MPIALISFIAGFLTILAPCVFTLLPIILGGSLSEKNIRKPIIVISSLVLSIFLFTILLKATTFFINIPNSIWQIISGSILLLVGINMLFPKLWETLSIKFKFYKTEEILGNTSQKKGLTAEILLGLSLGPVFSTCSPTYAIIIGNILPVNLTEGIFYLTLFCFGLSVPLFLIALLGQTITSKLRFATNPTGKIKRISGILLILTGLLITTGLDKQLEIFILDSGYQGPIELEQSLLEM